MIEYLKLADDSTFWYADGNGRVRVETPEQMYAFGLHPVRTVTADELEAIPVVTDIQPEIAEDEEE